MDKKYLDLTIEYANNVLVRRQVAIRTIINHPEQIDIIIKDDNSIIDERLSILKVTGLKITID